jgi:hypothetical protein
MVGEEVPLPWGKADTIPVVDEKKHWITKSTL